MQKLVLDRKRWARGLRFEEITEGENVSLTNALLGGDGCMCCLGFHLAQCGVPRAALLGEGCPEELAANLADEMGLSPEDGQALDPIPSYLTTYSAGDDELARGWSDTPLTDAMMLINDDPDIESDEERVEKLNAALRERRVKLEIVLVATPEECEAAGGLRADFATRAA